MKAAVVLFALVVIVSARPDDKYTDKYDNTNIHELLQNPKLLENYFNCIMGLGKCTAEGKELKSHIVDAMQTHCSRCTEKQQESARIIIKFLINEKPDHWKKLCEKYDPSGKYQAEYENELKTLK